MRFVSRKAARILACFLASPDQALYGSDIMQAADVKSRSMYPILGRLERLDWIAGSVQTSDGPHPPRRVYTVVADAEPEIRLALSRSRNTKELVSH